jgi:hypothetical protein
MARSLRVNWPGAGDWVMARVGGVFNDKTDHCVSCHGYEGETLGGVVFTGFLYGSIILHMAGNETHWASRDFLWMVYDYAFNQLGVRKCVGLVASNNSRALSIDLRMGFRIEAKLTDMLADGGDLMILTLKKADCKWLRITPRHYRSNTEPDVRCISEDT